MKIKYLALTLCGVAILSLAACKSTPAPSSGKGNSTTKSATAESAAEKAAREKAAAEKASKEAQIEKTNRNLLEKAESARSAAVEAGAEKYYPKLFAEVDKQYDALKKKVAANPKTDHSAEINEITKKFEALEKASLAKKMQEEIKGFDFDFTSVDNAAATAGEEALRKFGAMDLNSSGDDLLAQAEAAYKAYKTLMDKGYRAMAAKERAAALEAKKDADSVKAAVAKKSKDDYAKASNKFVRADASYSRGSTYDAFEGYKEAKETFLSLYEIVKKDREEAQAALEKAKQRVAEAASYSAEADDIAPLKEKVAGIEDENVTLLEKDEFANPDDAIIHVENNENAKTVEKAAAEAIAEEEAKNKAGAKK